MERPEWSSEYISELEQKIRVLNALVDSSGAGMYVTDFHTGEILFVNQKMSAWGKSRLDVDDLVGTSCWKIVNPEGVDERCAFCPRLKLLDRRGEPFGIYTWEQHFENHNVWLRISSQAIRWTDGRLAQMNTFTDITETQMEKQQKRLLMQTADKEREANQLKSNFLSNMSHEIRTPMNAIIGLTDIELRKKNQGASAEVFKKINTAAKNLLQIINDILDLSKIEANKMVLFSDEFELEEVLNNALLVVSPRLSDVPVELMLDVTPGLPKYIVGDKVRLWQILKNHLDNAAKHTGAGSIVLSVYENRELSDEENISISFVISDTGIGMSEEQLSRAFMLYEQFGSDTALRSAGTGLGLPISKQLCEMMHGETTIESEPGVGTTVHVTIPFLRSQDDKLSDELHNGSYLSGVRVLLVDDSKLSIHAMRAMLKNCGALCFEVCSGEAALEIIRAGHGHFDVVILDYIMGGMNGVQTAKLIREQCKNPPKIIMLTAYENLIDKPELESWGVDTVIDKPFAPLTFIRKVKETVTGGRSGGQDSFAGFRGRRVLVCEDVEINREIISAMLGELGVEWVLAVDGKEGVEKLAAGDKFDLVLMDLHMPVMDGYEATRRIRAMDGLQGLPIISLTADVMTETVKKCMDVGMSGVLAKPVEFIDLQRTLRQWLSAAAKV